MIFPAPFLVVAFGTGRKRAPAGKSMAVPFE